MSENWFVITGAPSSGITATTEHIATLGYHTVPEAARIFIDKGIAEEKQINDIRGDELAFQETILRMKQNMEKRMPRDRMVFFQRGIPDTLAYYRLIGADTKGIYDACRDSSYGKVFILEPLPFRRDYARTEKEEDANRLFGLLREAYEELGLEVVIVPKAGIKERADIILSNIKRA